MVVVARERIELPTLFSRSWVYLWLVVVSRGEMIAPGARISKA